MDEQQLRNLIAGGETSTVELKVAAPRPAELAERLCGFANSQGGKLILGVEDSTLKLRGVKDVSAAIDILMRAGRLCQPPLVFAPPEPEIFRLDDKVIVMATVRASNGPVYQAGGVFWVRRGTHTIPQSIEEISEQLYNRGMLRWELRPAEEATLEDLDQAAIDNFLSHRAKALEGVATKRFTNQAEALVGLKCAIKVGDMYAPTNAGLLFFGKYPQEFLLQSGAVCVLYPDELGMSRFTDRRVMRGSLIKLIEQIEAFLRQYNPVSSRMEGFKRIDTSYPLGALREAVLNAIIHRDYSREGESIRVFYYKDRLQIHSPGLLMPGVTLELLEKGEAPSRLRNPVIAGLLRDMPGYVETIGSGIRLMIGEMKELDLPPPEFRETSEFVVTFRHKTQEKDITITTPQNYQPLPVLVEGKPLVLNPTVYADQNARLEAAIMFVQERGSISNGEYRSLTGVSESTGLRDLELLVKNGTLKALGQKRARRYLLP